MPRKRSLVVLSGGQDSSTCLFWAVSEFGVENVHAVTFDYNQRHSIEVDAARTVAHLAGLGNRHEIVKLGPILAGTSPLTNQDERLEQYTDYASMDAIIGGRVEKTFVPMRNALFLTIAANRAAVLGSHIVTGVCQEDNANYPDCRRSFIATQEATINEALGNPAGDSWIQIYTPLIQTTKAESVHMSRTIAGAYSALAYTHTAYDGQFPPLGKDHATVLRAHGFEEANMPDPLILRAWRLGLMKLPNTPNYTVEKIDAAMSIIRVELRRSGLLSWWG